MEKLKATAEAGIDGVDLHYKIIDEEVVNAAKQTNLKVIAWTVDDIAEAKRLKELGVEGITTNKPAEIKSAL
jgi:glycerophosphoryl diester phosphodiesterase